ncbi:MAG TPA: chemotaxis protein CheD [Spirochaetota bacterium]|nr:chemotaxis protein CheD [Spirochaetota bacterium]
MNSYSVPARGVITKKATHRILHGGKKTLNILPGDYAISREDIVITTVLGSCISVCFYSDRSPYCGMNHFMLPESRTEKSAGSIMHSDAAFYGINAMEQVINALLKNNVRKEDIRAKVFGGGNVIAVNVGKKTVGDQNIEFAFEFLKTENIPITACSVGGDFARKIFFHVKTKDVYMTRLGSGSNTHIIEEEKSLLNRGIHMEDITLFR